MPCEDGPLFHMLSTIEKSLNVHRFTSLLWIFSLFAFTISTKLFYMNKYYMNGCWYRFIQFWISFSKGCNGFSIFQIERNPKQDSTTSLNVSNAFTNFPSSCSFLFSETIVASLSVFLSIRRHMFPVNSPEYNLGCWIPILVIQADAMPALAALKALKSRLTTRNSKWSLSKGRHFKNMSESSPENNGSFCATFVISGLCMLIW